MNWIAAAILAQFVLGSSAVVDKFLLAKRFPNPYGYAFWLGLLGIFSVLLIPFGFAVPHAGIVVVALAAGVTFLLALLFYFAALFRGEASTVTLIVGSLSPIVTYLAAFYLLETDLRGYQWGAFALLLVGGALLVQAEKKEFRGAVLALSLASAVIYGVSNTLTKGVFEHASFIAGFVWIKFGGVLASLLLLTIPQFRALILARSRRTRIERQGLYFANRAYAALGSLLLYFAFSIGHPALVDATNTLKYGFIFLGGWLILRERFSGRVLAGKIAALILICTGIFVLVAGDYLAATRPDPNRPIRWGLTFSQKFMQSFGVEWREAYHAMFRDLGARHVRLVAYWDSMEPARRHYVFDDLDFQMKVAEAYGAEVVLAVGQKTPRWPECHVPAWTFGWADRERNTAHLEFLTQVVERYRDAPALAMWQVENEPFLPFGEGACSTVRAETLDREITLVRSLDPRHQILITDSGEIGRWYRAAVRGDVFGTTMYRRVHNPTFGFVEYPLPPEFFRLKEKAVRMLTREYEKPYLVIELAAEPWLPKQLYETSPQEQFARFDIDFFSDTIAYAKATGFPAYYLWGGEWWYWLAYEKGHPEFWEYARTLYRTSQ